MASTIELDTVTVLFSEKLLDFGARQGYLQAYLQKAVGSVKSPECYWIIYQDYMLNV